MGDGNFDSFHTGENYEETQDKECEPIRLIPEGFVVDDALTSISLEDFEEDDEVWLVDIPVTVDPKKLFGQQLDFRQNTSFIIDEQADERCISLPSSEPCSTICLLSSRNENSTQIVALNAAGKISININYDVPELGSMIPDSSSVQLPEGLKVRHPFLGPRYKAVVKSMEATKGKNVNSEDDISPIKLVVQNKKNILVNEGISPDLDPVEEVSRESLKVTRVKNEVLSPKKSKKRKRDSLYEDRNNEGVKYFDVDPCHLPKKCKNEDKGGTNVQGFPGIEVFHNELEIPPGEAVPMKKSRKDKKRASEIIASEVYALQENMDDTTNASLQKVKKKIKKEMKEPRWSGEEEGVTDISQLGSSKKAKKKKKRDLEGVSEEGPSSVLPKDIVMFGKVPGQTLERVKEAKNKLMEEQYERGLDISYKGDSIQEMVHSEKRIKKEKSKKHCTIDNVAIEVTNVDSNALHLMAGQKMKGTAEGDMQSEGIEVLHEEGDHIEKKRKKDRKRATEVVNVDMAMEILKEEVDVIPGTPGHTPKKKKKKIKQEMECSVEEGEVANVSLVEPSVPPEVVEETPKKAKKKKRDSAYESGSGQGDVLSDVSMVKEIPNQTSKRVKKIKKEMKRELGAAVLEVSCEGEGDTEPGKSKKKLTVDKVGMEAVCVNYQDPSLIAGRTGAEGMETFSEEVEILTKEGDHVKKKGKKDKKRGSEIVSGKLDVETWMKEVDVMPDTPGKTKKKKKKIKEEHALGVKEEEVTDVLEPSVPPEVGEVTPKKAKKKKRDSSGQGLSEDIVYVEEAPGQVSEVVDKSKKNRWYIDREPSIVEPCNNILRSPDSRKMKKVCGETVIGMEQEGDNSGIDSIFKNDSKKWKRRHTMDSATIAAITTDPNRAQFLPEVIMEGKSQHKKRQSLQTQGDRTQLLSSKKEKKIKKEKIG